MTGPGYRSAQGETTKCVVEASEYPRRLLYGMAWETHESDQTWQGSMFSAEECEQYALGVGKLTHPRSVSPGV